jgi:hypothetical protein
MVTTALRLISSLSPHSAKSDNDFSAADFSATASGRASTVRSRPRMARRIVAQRREHIIFFPDEYQPAGHDHHPVTCDRYRLLP